MTHSLALGTWCRRLGLCAAIAALAGCNGSESLGGTGGERPAEWPWAATPAAASGLGGSSAGGAGERSVGGSFGQRQPGRRHPDDDRRLVLDEDDAAEALCPASGVHSGAAEPPRATQPPPGRRLVGPGGARRFDRPRSAAPPRAIRASSTQCRKAPAANTTLTAGDTFISDADMMPNYTDPLSNVVQCIALLGDQGCGFEHQLGSIDRALGADGHGPAPSQNAGFLRPEALLVILMLTNEDDCSAPPDTTIYSLNGAQQNISNPDGPIANYRCNGGPRGGHLCQDPHATQPDAPTSRRRSTRPATRRGRRRRPLLDLANCQDNETGTSALTPVSRFVSDIKALKTDPDNQILVATIAAPAAPYTVTWLPAAGRSKHPAGRALAERHALLRASRLPTTSARRRRSIRPTAPSATRPSASPSSPTRSPTACSDRSATPTSTGRWGRWPPGSVRPSSPSRKATPGRRARSRGSW